MGAQDQVMYRALAGVYDKMAYDFDYPAWTDWYEKLILAIAPGAKEICDAGCGTGALTVGLSQKGYKLIGFDLSGDMLGVASDKARKAGQRIAFSLQDMRSFKLPHPVDAVICACDGVNYLLTENAVKSFFNCAKCSLKPGGALAFDISNREKLSNMAKQGLYAEETDDCSYIWQNELSGDVLEMEISFYIKCTDGRYEHRAEQHRQRLWSARQIQTMLNEAGFTDISVFGGDAGESQAPGGKRAYFSARRP